MTSIEWTHVPDGKGGRKKGETLNPQVGCSEVSAGCRNCYAARVAARQMTEHHKGLTVARTNGVHWNGKINRAPEQLEKPLRWRKPRGIFWGSMTDLFHESTMATEDGRRYIAASFGVMAATRRHTHLAVTKRPLLMREWFAWVKARRGAGSAEGLVRDEAEAHIKGQHPYLDWSGEPMWPLPNVWLITTTEDQRRVDERIQHLIACPAVVRGLSVEPMLGPVVLPPELLALGQRTWIICGGESGPGARPMHPDWARSLRDQCVEAGVPFFFKQWGAWAQVGEQANDATQPGATTWTHMVGRDGRVYAQGDDMPLDFVREIACRRVAFMRRVGKKVAGRELDGRTWDEFPCS